MIIRTTICVSKIPKEKVRDHENGKKYLWISLLDNREQDQYGNDGIVTIDLSKEEREKGAKAIIIGNWKYVVRPDEAPKATFRKPEATFKEPHPKDEGEDSLPF